MMLPRPDRAAILARLPPLPEPLYWGVCVNHVFRNRWEVSIQMRCRRVDIVGVVNGEEHDAATVEALVARAIQQAREVGAISAPPTQTPCPDAATGRTQPRLECAMNHPPVSEPSSDHVPTREITHHRDVDPGDTLNARLFVWGDERDPNGGNAAHHYEIVHPERVRPTVVVHFQHGPRNVEGSQPGATDQSVLAILIDRYEGYQAGPFACPENEAVLDHLWAALRCMGDRSRARREQGVIGQNKAHKSA